MNRPFFLFGMLALAGLAGCAKDERPSAATALARVPVHTVVLRLETSSTLTALAGIVRPTERAIVAAKLAGTIEDLTVQLGQPVSSGQCLGRISAPELAARLQQSQARLREAERDLARERDLLHRAASPAATVQSLEDRLALTQGVVREAEALLAQTFIRAPFAGVVVDRIAHSGDLALPGLPLVAIEGSSHFQVEFDVPVSLAGQVAPRAEIVIVAGPNDRQVVGQLAELSSAADTHTHTVHAKVDLPAAAELRSGDFVRVLWPSGELPALYAPLSALSMFGQMERIFVVHAGRAQLRLIRTGQVRSDRVQIQAGAEPGDTVVLRPPPALRDGSPVDLLP